MRGSMKDWRIIKRMTESEEGTIYKTKRYAYKRIGAWVYRIPIMLYRIDGEKAFYYEEAVLYCDITQEGFGALMK